jgi:hypothetical protein
MPREQKTPQQKKQMELKKDHFTSSNAPHAFRTIWRNKKALANRQYRRKSDEILSPAKPAMSAKDVEIVVGDVTAKRLQKSVSAKRLRKTDTVSIGEKIEVKLENRTRRVSRKADHIRHFDPIAKSAVGTLVALEGEKLNEVVGRIARLVQVRNPTEWVRLYQSKDPIDRAIFFAQEIIHRNAYYCDALRRNQKLCQAFQSWQRKANRILTKQRQPAQRKLEQKIATEKKLKGALRQKRQS